MIKKVVKTSAKRRQTTGATEMSIKKVKKQTKSKYRHYSYYQPSKSTHATKQRQTKKVETDQPIKHQTHTETINRRRIAVTIMICLLIIGGGLIVAEVFFSHEHMAKTDKLQVNKVAHSKNIETPPKSEIESAREKAEQNLNIIGGILNSSTFSADNMVKLKVPIYKQVYTQSCEAASLRMALAYRGIETTDIKILELMNYDDQPVKKIDGGWVWGDPHQMFVGDKNGDQTKMTGYGVFGEPIQKTSEKLGRTAVVQNEVKPEWLARQIYAGNPVVLWGVSTKIRNEKWTTPEAKEITAPIRTHTRLVIGVKGDINQPTGFYLNDPDGTVKYWTTAQLTSNIAAGIGQAVAIH